MSKNVSSLSIKNYGSYVYNGEAYKIIDGKWIYVDKLALGDGKFDDFPIQQITKMKIKGQKGYQSNFIIKLTIGEKDEFYSFNRLQHLQWFVHILWGRGICILDNIECLAFQNLCDGVIVQRSIFGEWNDRYVMITKKGMTCAKEKKIEPDNFIDRVDEIWTRFQVIQKKSYMVFKFRYRLFKYQFGVPMSHLLKWAQAFYSLINFQ